MNMPHDKKSPSLVALLDAPLPETRHPLGKLAQAWILFNCVAFGVVGGAIGANELLRLGYRMWTRRPPTDDLVDIVTGCGGLVGLMLGLLGASWIVHRAGKKGLSIALLTMGLIPVVGPIVSVVCGVYWALKMGMRWIGKAASGEEGGSG